MLDKFLEVALTHKERDDARQEMVAAFMHFPEEELHKIASGEAKLAYDDDGDWLKKFEGTPMYDQALALEEQCLQLDIQDQQQRIAENEERHSKNEQRDAIWDAKDAIRLKKRLLELELRKSQLGGEGEEGAEHEALEAPTEQGTEEAPEKLGAVDYLYLRRQQGLQLVGGLLKEAKELTPEGREHIKAKNFAIPKGKGGEGSYPIHDVEHARNALVRVRTFGGVGEKAKVYSAVSKKYPALATRSDVIPEKLQRKAEKKVGVGKGEESMKLEAPKQKLSGALPAALQKAKVPKGKDIGKPGYEGGHTGKMPPGVKAKLKQSCGLKVAEAAEAMLQSKMQMAKTAKGEWVYGAAPGLIGGGLTGAAMGGLLSHSAGEMAGQVGRNPEVEAKRSAVGQMVGGLGGATAGGLIGGIGGLAVSPQLAGALGRVGGLVGGHGGAYLGHRVATGDLRKQVEAIQAAKAQQAAQEAAAAPQEKTSAALMKESMLCMAKTAEARLEAGIPFDELTDLEKLAIGGMGSIAKGLWNAARAGWGGKGLAKTVGKKGLGGAWEAGKGYTTAAAKKNPMAVAGLAGAAGLGAGALGMGGLHAITS